MRAAGYSVLLSAALLAGHLAEAESERAFGRWFWHVTAGLPVAHLNDEGSPYRFSLGAGHPVFHERVSMMADLVFAYYEVSGTADEHPRPDISGGSSTSLGLDLLLRIDFLQTDKLNYYLEGGGGIQSMLNDPPFPADGSDQNMSLFAGPGVSIPIAERMRIALSLQWFHISNAWLLGNNSGYDGIQLVIGTEWAL